MRVAIVEDMLMFREVLVRSCRDEGHDVCGEACSAREGLELCAGTRPDLLLLDLRLPDADGVDVARTVRATIGSTKILALSAYLNDYLHYRLERCGVHGFVDKNLHTVAALREALRIVGDGGTWFSPSFHAIKVRRLIDPNSFDKRLSDRELQILCHIANGMNDDEIATQLGIAPRTAQGHRSAMMRKLKLAGTAKLMAYAVAKGFTRPSNKSS